MRTIFLIGLLFAVALLYAQLVGTQWLLNLTPSNWDKHLVGDESTLNSLDLINYLITENWPNSAQRPTMDGTFSHDKDGYKIRGYLKGKQVSIFSQYRTNDYQHYQALYGTLTPWRTPTDSIFYFSSDSTLSLSAAIRMPEPDEEPVPSSAVPPVYDPYQDLYGLFYSCGDVLLLDGAVVKMTSITDSTVTILDTIRLADYEHKTDSIQLFREEGEHIYAKASIYLLRPQIERWHNRAFAERAWLEVDIPHPNHFREEDLHTFPLSGFTHLYSSTCGGNYSNILFDGRSVLIRHIRIEVKEQKVED
ncbi:MAG: hypothetical protein AAFZ63_03400 [Bacteroidota bacterium]